MLISPDNIESIYPIKIYTDASLKNINGKTYVSYGYVIDSKTYGIEEENYLAEEGTVSYGEMNAIYFALLRVEQLIRSNVIGNCKIALFSDSEYCVNSLNKWITGWYNRQDPDGNYIKSDGKPVNHQNLINYIISIIVNNHININIFHVYGHVSNFSQIQKLKSKLSSSGLNVSTQMVKEIVNLNNKVDVNSRDNLRKLDQYRPFIQYETRISNSDMNSYKKLTKIKK